MKTLRSYQEAAIKNVAASIAKGKIPVGVLPVASGKSLIIAEIARRILQKNWNRRILSLVDTKELIEQNYDEFCQNVGPQIANYAGIYSSGLRRKEQEKKIIFAGIQSYVKCVRNSEPVDFIIIDECHLVPTKKNSQYRKVLAIEKEKNHSVACMGFTGTPWRMDLNGGLITDGDGFFNEIAYSIWFQELIELGYLCPVVSYDRNITSADLSKVSITNGDFKDDQATKAFLEVLPAQVKEILVLGKNRKKWLIFCQTKEHALAMFNLLKENTDRTITYVFGDSPDRDQKIKAYTSGEISILINVNMLIKGFNCVDIDFLVLCFASKSINKYIQAVGRSMRVAPGKENAFVLDFGGNIERIGPIDQVKIKKKTEGSGNIPTKECRKCGEIVHISLKFCPKCGKEFFLPPKEVGKELTEKSKKGGIISTEDEIIDVAFMSSKLILTKAGHTSVVMEFYKHPYQTWPSHSEYINLWHDNLFAVKNGFDKLNLIIPGKNDLFKSLRHNPKEVVQVINNFIKNKEIQIPKSIFLRQKEKDGKVYKEITGMSY